MEFVKLNEKLLGIIVLLQRSRDYRIAKHILLEDDTDWYRQVESEYKALPKTVFDEAGIAQNAHNFDTALHFVVTPEMLNCRADKLTRFATGFWK